MRLSHTICALLLACQPFVANMAVSAEKAAPAAKIQQAEVAKINLNTATEEQLITLKGIGKKKAAAIIAYRNEHGPFNQLEQLAEVKGISPAFVELHSGELTLK